MMRITINELFPIAVESSVHLEQKDVVHPIQLKYTPMFYRLNPVAKLYRTNKIDYQQTVPAYKKKPLFTGFLAGEMSIFSSDMDI